MLKLYVIKYLSCVGTECLYAPQPPVGSNIEMVLHDDADKEMSSPKTKQNSERIIHKHANPFDSTIIYKCLEKTKFSHDYNQINVSATCLKENQWTVPDYWGKCVACKLINLFILYRKPYYRF